MLRSRDYKGVNVVEEEGVEVFRLVSGDPNIYEGGWDTPQHMKDAVIRAIDEGFNMYPQRLEGLREELVDSIVGWEKEVNGLDYPPESIIPTQGVAGGIRLAFPKFLGPGDELLLTDPTYIPYKAVGSRLGRAVFFRTIEEEEWIPDLEDLRCRITPRTKALVLIHPQNPTGCLYDEKTLKAIADIAGEHGFPLVSDEIYGPFTLDGANFHPVASVAGDVPVITMNSISKAYVATGWRVGHISIHDPESRIEGLREEMQGDRGAAGTIPTPIAFGAMAAYRGGLDHIPGMLEELSKRRDLSYKRLNEIQGLSATRPQAAFFIFPKAEATGTVWEDDYEFARELKAEARIDVNPGSRYGAEHSLGHFRVPFLPGLEVLEKVYDDLETFMEKKLD
jgi:aspartate/methionine/tyrosine aminotransferase